MSRKEPKSVQTFVNSLPVMHVSVRHMLPTSKQCEKVQKKIKNLVLANFHEAFEPRHLTP